MRRARLSDAAPATFVVGVLIIVVGLIVHPLVVTPIGVSVALLSGFAWMHKASDARSTNAGLDLPAVKAQDERLVGERTLSRGTLLLGAALGLLVAAPVVAFAIFPSFQGRRHRGVDLGPFGDFPEGKYTVVMFLLDSSEGATTRRAAYIRNNGFVSNEPSFTIISNRCTHVGCPTQPNGPVLQSKQHMAHTETGPVQIIPIQPAGFGCPCHASQFDTEGNRIAGPAPRALDRYEFSIRDSRLYLESLYSVGRVDGSGADAQIHAVPWRPPGEPASGPESLLYPVQAGSKV